MDAQPDAGGAPPVGPDAETTVIADTDPIEPAKPPAGLTRRYRDDDVSDDDRDLGWGDGPATSDRGDGWYLRERPPHHG